MRPPDPLVSVIIPAYGRARYLGNAIESARRQRYAHREIIVVDDGSPTGDVAEVARSAGGVRYIRRPNGGASVARNSGVHAATGELLVFLDSDDELLPDALDVGVRALERHPDCAFAYGRCEWMDGEGSSIAGPVLEQASTEHYRALLRSNFIIIDTVMHRRATFEAVGGFRTDYLGVEDYDLYLRLARRYTIHYHGALVARYRRHESNLSNDAGAMLSSVMRLLRAERRALRDPALRAVSREGIFALRDYWGDKVVTHLRACARAGRWREVARDAASLLRHHPALLAAQIAGAVRTRATALSGPGVSD